MPFGAEAETVPSGDWRNTVDTSRTTRAVYFGLTANGTVEITNPDGGDAITVPAGGTLLPFRTDVAMSGAGFTFVYIY